MINLEQEEEIILILDLDLMTNLVKVKTFQIQTCLEDFKIQLLEQIVLGKIHSLLITLELIWAFQVDNNAMIMLVFLAYVQKEVVESVKMVRT